MLTILAHARTLGGRIKTVSRLSNDMHRVSILVADYMAFIVAKSPPKGDPASRRDVVWHGS